MTYFLTTYLFCKSSKKNPVTESEKIGHDIMLNTFNNSDIESFYYTTRGPLQLKVSKSYSNFVENNFFNETIMIQYLHDFVGVSWVCVLDEELIVCADQEGRFVGEHLHAVDEKRDVKFADLEKSWFVCKVNKNVFQCTNNLSLYFYLFDQLSVCKSNFESRRKLLRFQKRFKAFYVFAATIQLTCLILAMTVSPRVASVLSETFWSSESSSASAGRNLTSELVLSAMFQKTLKLYIIFNWLKFGKLHEVIWCLSVMLFLDSVL